MSRMLISITITLAATCCGSVALGDDDAKSDAQLFQAAKAAAMKVQTGAEGAAIWDEFVKQNANSQFSQAAQKELALWKDRADKKLVRWGQAWEPESAVAERTAKAEELLKQAESAGDINEASKLFDQAIAVNPFRADIAFLKAVKLYQAGKTREAGQAWLKVLAIAPDNAAARNNLGVLAATAKQPNWAQAFAHLAKAAVVADDDRIWDNVDAVIGAADESGTPAVQIHQMEGQVRGAVESMRRTRGARKDEMRWGNKWIPEKDYQKFTGENEDIDRQTAARRSAIMRAQSDWTALKNAELDVTDKLEQNKKKLQKPRTREEAQKDQKRLNEQLKMIQQRIANVEKLGQQLNAAIKDLEQKRNVPQHADRYVMIGADGKSELASLDVTIDEESKKNKPKPPTGEGGGGGLFD